MIKRLQKPAQYVLSDGITQSMLASFLACRQRSKYQLDRWESVFGSAASALRGDLYHGILEEWYKYKTPASNLLNGAAAFLPEVIDSWRKRQSKHAPNVSAMDDAENFARAVFPEYVERWKKSDAKYKWEALEEVFDVKWEQWRLRGKRDGTLMLNGSRWLFETKTKAQIDEAGIMDSLAFDLQNLFYLTVLRTQNRPAIGVIYNIVRYPQLRIKKTETPEQFQERVAEDVRQRRNFYFMRFEVTYSEMVQEQFRNDLKVMLNEFEQWYTGKLPTYKNVTACITKIKCPFLTACASGSMAGYKQTRTHFKELLTDAPS
jgi:hypothetical protein